MGFFDKLFKKAKQTVSDTVSGVVSCGKSIVEGRVKELGKKASDIGRQVLGKKINETLSKAVGEVKKQATGLISKGAQLSSQMIDKAEKIFEEVKRKVPFADQILDKIVDKIPQAQGALKLFNIAKDMSHKLEDGILDPKEIAETLIDNGMRSVIDKMPRDVWLASKFL